MIGKQPKPRPKYPDKPENRSRQYTNCGVTSDGDIVQ